MADRISLPVLEPLVDSQQRQISYLRLSLTDRCNFRCTYCMPEEGIPLVQRREILNLEEIVRLVRLFIGLGVRRVRLTGGEPTVRKEVVGLVEELAALPGLEQVVMTSNGHRFPELALPLARAGLAGVNISLDTLDAQRFAALTRRGDLSRVIAGIDAAIAAGLDVKLNIVALAGINEDELYELCDFAWRRGIVPRFIEHMPMSSGLLYRSKQHLSAAEIREHIAIAAGASLSPRESGAHRGPSRYWSITGRPQACFGIISAMSEHFCDSCNRVRISSKGELHTCLADDGAVALLDLLRGGASDAVIREQIRRAVWQKRDGHKFELSGDGGPTKHMISIGG